MQKEFKDIFKKDFIYTSLPFLLLIWYTAWKSGSAWDILIDALFFILLFFMLTIMLNLYLTRKSIYSAKRFFLIFNSLILVYYITLLILSQLIYNVEFSEFFMNSPFFLIFIVIIINALLIRLNKPETRIFLRNIYLTLPLLILAINLCLFFLVSFLPFVSWVK
jgi:hypothetical protein